jgi:hypothetical protein
MSSNMPAFKTKALTNPQHLGRGEHLHPAQEVRKRGGRLARAWPPRRAKFVLPMPRGSPALLDGCLWTANDQSQLAPPEGDLAHVRR